MRYSIKLSYCGSGLHGWQIQPNAESVQGLLEKALTTLLRCDTPVTGAGRTDAGVNAAAYVAHFDAVDSLDAAHLVCKLNAILPSSIVIHDISEVTEDFHARFGATRREYTYFLHRVKDPFSREFSYQCSYPNLDFNAMNEAAKCLIGTHDFRCFEKTGADNKTSICTVMEAEWREYTPSHLSVMGAAQPGSYWYFRISADRFLRNMVRAVVGTLVEVGRGKRSIDEFAALVLPADTPPSDIPQRSSAGESVPGNALFLSKIKY